MATVGKGGYTWSNQSNEQSTRFNMVLHKYADKTIAMGKSRFTEIN